MKLVRLILIITRRLLLSSAEAACINIVVAVNLTVPKGANCISQTEERLVALNFDASGMTFKHALSGVPLG